MYTVYMYTYSINVFCIYTYIERVHVDSVSAGGLQAALFCLSPSPAVRFCRQQVFSSTSSEFHLRPRLTKNPPMFLRLPRQSGTIEPADFLLQRRAEASVHTERAHSALFTLIIIIIHKIRRSTRLQPGHSSSISTHMTADVRLLEREAIHTHTHTCTHTHAHTCMHTHTHKFETAN